MGFFIHLIGKANTEVGRFDELLKKIPNPSVLLSPLTTNEAVLSSRSITPFMRLERYRSKANPRRRRNKKCRDARRKFLLDMASKQLHMNNNTLQQQRFVALKPITNAENVANHYALLILLLITHHLIQHNKMEKNFTDIIVGHATQMKQ